MIKLITKHNNYLFEIYWLIINNKNITLIFIKINIKMNNF